jgi:phenylpropionate dioxygenase-like ring-hydroxylating dioxygenase large terminal subunit
MSASSLPVSIDNLTPALRSCWHPVERGDRVGGEPRRVELLGAGYVLARFDGSGIRAFVDRCPHRNGRLSDGAMREGALTCPYHGWEFDAEGACQLIPALGPGAPIPKRACLQPVNVTERYGMVWLAPETPSIPLIEIAEWDDAGLRRVWLPAVDIGAGAAQFIDNFLDFAHFPFVHAGTFGAAESPLLHDYSVERHADRLMVRYEHTIANREDPLVETGEHLLLQPRTMRYEYTVPFAALLRLELPVTGTVNTIVTFCQPVAADVTRVHTVMMRNDCPDDVAVDAAIAYELAILEEDRRVIERLPDTALPLEATSQLHTRADRLSVEYRRLLRELLQGKS